MPQDLDYLKDLTSVGRVYQYLSHDVNIAYALRAEEGIDIGSVAGHVVEGGTESEVFIHDLLNSKKLLYSPDLESDHAEACYVIRVEPILIYQKTGKLYE